MAVSPENLGKTPRVISEEEYYALDEKSEVRLEFVGGRIRPLYKDVCEGENGPVAMAGASRSHVYVSSRIVAALVNRLVDRPCEVGASDLKVKVEATNEKFYPDVVVHCEDARFDEHQRDTLLTPILIIEVLSPSTQGYDAAEKLEAYQQIPTLEHYLLVDQRRVRVQHYRRLGENEWHLSIFHWRHEEIVLDAINIRIAVDEFYRGLDIPEGLVIVPRENAVPEDALPE